MGSQVWPALVMEEEVMVVERTICVTVVVVVLVV